MANSPVDSPHNLPYTAVLSRPLYSPLPWLDCHRLLGSIPGQRIHKLHNLLYTYF